MIKFLIALTLLLAVTAVWAAPAEAQTPPEITTRFGLPSNAVELTRSRSQNRKAFQLVSGQTAMVFQQGLHYQRPDGRWVEPVLQFGAARTAEALAFVMGSDLVIIGSKGESITWELPERPQNTNGRLVYQDRGITWTYKKLNAGVKLEGLVSTLQGVQTYTFSYRALSPLAIGKNGTIEGDGFVIARPLIIDTNGKILTANWVLGNGQLEVTFDDVGLTPPYVIDPTTNFDTANDGRVTGVDTSYPPACDSVLTSAISSTKFFSSPNHQITVGLIEWNTASLPDSATIDSATFGFTLLGGISNADGRNWNGEWYGVGTIECADHTDSVGTTAFAIALGSVSSPITVSSPTTISKTGNTGLRLGISGGAPTGLNDLSIEDSGSGTAARLAVTFTAMTVTSVSPNEVANNGTKSFTITGTSLTGVTSVRLEKTSETNINCTSVVVVGPTSVTMDCNLTGAVDGLWNVVVVHSSSETATGSGILEINALSLTASTPTTALPTGSETLTLTGDGFDTGAQVTLERSGESDIVCTGESVASFISMTASCNLTGVASGFWDVVVTNTDTTAATLTNGLFVSSIITLQATGLTSGEKTVRIVGDSTGIFLFIDDVLQDSHGTQAVIIDNANDYQMFSNSAMPYVEFAKISVEGVLQLHYEFDDLPDHELTDRSGEGHSAIARYPDTIDGFTVALQSAAGSAAGGDITVEPGSEIIGDFDVIDDFSTTPSVPGSGFFLLDIFDVFTSGLFPFQVLSTIFSVGIVLTGVVVSAKHGLNHTLFISFVVIVILAILWRMGAIPWMFAGLMSLPMLFFLMWKRFNP